MANTLKIKLNKHIYYFIYYSTSSDYSQIVVLILHSKACIGAVLLRPGLRVHLRAPALESGGSKKGKIKIYTF